MAPSTDEADPEPREAAPEPAPPAVEPVRTAARDAAPSRPDDSECDIRWWRGYVYSKFYAYARTRDGEEHVIGESPDFRWRKPHPPPEEGRPLAAHRALVGDLERRGWAVVGRGVDWYALRLRPRHGRTRRRTSGDGS
jgi:hypothetical protein